MLNVEVWSGCTCCCETLTDRAHVCMVVSRVIHPELGQSVFIEVSVCETEICRWTVWKPISTQKRKTHNHLGKIKILVVNHKGPFTKSE